MKKKLFFKENGIELSKIITIIILLFFQAIFLFYKVFPLNNKNDYDLIIPTSSKDINLFIEHLKFYKKYLNYCNIILIGPSNVSDIILNEISVKFINEDILLPKRKINEFLLKMRNTTTDRDGWYEQQFIKMAYSNICKKEYYLVWDIDTIPIKPVKFFEKNNPIFDMKTEHNIPYFETIDLLFPGLQYNNLSYISEHMMVKTTLMKNLLEVIEFNSNIPGKKFWEKILMAIEFEEINYSGFSEYETYGSYVDTKYPNLYYHRNWYSKRDITSFFGNSKNLDEKDIKWLSKDYYALSFEKWIKFDENNLEIVKNSILQKAYNPNIFFLNFDCMRRKHKKLNKIHNN